MMRRMSMLVVLGCLAPIAAQAAPPAHPWERHLDPDWPCQQIKVPDVSVASIWTGPPIDKYMNTWRNDAGVADLVQTVAERRVKLDQAKADIAKFAQQVGSAKQDKLLAVLAGLFEVLGQERSSVMAGLDRFGKRQKTYATQIRGELDALQAEQDSKTPDTKKVQTLTQRITWDTQIFQQRRETLQYACAVPGIIEQRLFALARAIQQQLG